jgi:hypothetical protein
LDNGNATNIVQAGNALGRYKNEDAVIVTMTGYTNFLTRSRVWKSNRKNKKQYQRGLQGGYQGKLNPQTKVPAFRISNAKGFRF